MKLSVSQNPQQLWARDLMPRRAAIEKLRTDNEALKEEMQLENKFSVRPTSSSAAATIDALRLQSDACTQQVLVPL